MLRAMPHTPIHIVGGGLAGSEAAWQIAQAGVPVVLHEMRPVRLTEAHKTDGLAERLAHPVGDDARHRVVAAAGGIGHD